MGERQYQGSVLAAGGRAARFPQGCTEVLSGDSTRAVPALPGWALTGGD